MFKRWVWGEWTERFPPWHNTRIVKVAGAPSAIAALKQQPG